MSEVRWLPGGGSGYQIVAEPSVWASTAASFLGRRLASIADRDRITMGLSGGSTPGPVYQALARDPHPPWDRIEIYFADERIVPLDDPASNYRFVREHLLDGVPISASNVHPMPVEADDLAAAAREYGEALPDHLDVLILGIGEDGHTASLFPGSDALMATDPVVLARAPKPPHERMTITAPVILAARQVMLLARGTSKRAAIRRAMSDDGEVPGCPARLARRGVWILGSDAIDVAEGAPAG